MKIIGRIFTARSGLVQIAVVAALLALGVHLLAVGIVAEIGDVRSFIAGAIVIVGTLVIAFAIQFRGLDETVQFGGVVPILKNRLIQIPDYDLTEMLVETFGAVTKENEALRLQWENEPILTLISPESKEADGKNLEGTGASLLRESLEYVYLELLSRHLTEYFSDDSFTGMCREHSRDDLLPLVASNRVLDLLSRPLEDRIVLLETKSDKNRQFTELHRETKIDGLVEERVLIQAGDGEHLYRRLELVLPADVKIQRVGPGHIRLDGKIVRTDLKIDFGGLTSKLDHEFLDRYMNISPRDFYGQGANAGQLWSVMFEFSSHVKWRGIFTSRGWRLNRWAESFVEAANQSLDINAFLEHLQWNSVRTIIRLTSPANPPKELVKRAKVANSKQTKKPTKQA